MLTKEQLEVINHGSGNILVSASAGSGKTHTMIERVKRLIIKEGVSVNQILAVTFTESAAADMKEKLRTALISTINGDYDKDFYGILSSEQINNLEMQLEDLSNADISTMHAFCGKLIRSYFFVAGVSPDFKILDESDANVIKYESVEKTFKEFYDNGDKWFLKLVDTHAVGRMDENLKELVLSAYSFANSEAYPEQMLQKFNTVYGKEGFLMVATSLKKHFDDNLKPLIFVVENALNAFRQENLVKGCEFTATLLCDMKTALEKPDIYALNSFKNYKLPLTFERKLSEGAKELKEQVSDARAKFIKLLSRFIKCVGQNPEDDIKCFERCKEHTENFVKVVTRFSQIYTQEKREENALDFNDLEHFALKILADGQICQTVKEKYKFVFVDEYQDTNGVQEEIISKVCNDNVFMVGDVKQSIYSFRGCRSEFFTNKDNLMTANGEKVVRLNHNFRSATNVIKMVNAIFNHCMTKEVYGESYRDKSQLVAGGIYPQGFDGRAQIHFLKREERETKQEEQPRIYDILQENPEEVESEVQVLADLVASIISEERQKKFFDTKLKVERQVDFGDIAVLTRSRNSKYVRELVSGLVKNGLPVTSDSAENVCDYPEIKVVINALNLVDCFLQDLPLASTLKSAIGGFTVEELFEIVRFYDDNAPDNHGGFSDAYTFYVNNANTNLKDRLLEFSAYFEKVRLIADFVGAHGVLTNLVSDKKLEAFLYAKPDGINAVDRLRRFISASVVGGKKLTVKEFLTRIKACPDAFGLSPFASENTVKVSTIHASKGLEYPVVIVCGLERGFNDEDDYSEIMFSREYGLATLDYDQEKRIKRETPLRGLIREENIIQRMKEEMRLFYVATTRATYSLHMTFTGKSDVRKEDFITAFSFIDFIPKWLPITEYDKLGVQIKRKNSQVRKVIITNPDEQAVAKIKENFSFVYPFNQDTFLPLKAGVTALSTTEEDAPYVHVVFDEQSPDTESGTVAHKILECMDFYSGVGVKEQAERLVQSGIIESEKLARVNLDRLSNALNCQTFTRIKGHKLYRERAFLVNVEANKILDTKSCEPVLVQGVIDLLAVDGDNAEIIDYKYSSLTTQSLKQKYKKQLELYAYAVEKVLGKKVVGKTLINVFTGESIALD